MQPGDEVADHAASHAADRRRDRQHGPRHVRRRRHQPLDLHAAAARDRAHGAAQGADRRVADRGHHRLESRHRAGDGRDRSRKTCRRACRTSPARSWNTKSARSGPGESKRLELSLKAEKAGVIQNTIHVRGEGEPGGHSTRCRSKWSPRSLQVEVEGPKRRFLERQATYTLSVANPGTAPARDVELVGVPAAGHEVRRDRFARAIRPGAARRLLEPGRAAAGQGRSRQADDAARSSRASSGCGSKAGPAWAWPPPASRSCRSSKSAELVHTRQGPRRSDRSRQRDDLRDPRHQHRHQSGDERPRGRPHARRRCRPSAAKARRGPPATPRKVVFEPLARLNPQEEVIYKVQVQGMQAGRPPRPRAALQRRMAHARHPRREHAGV